VVLSRREGSSVVVAESFFADAPVVALAGAHVGALDYVNERTGLLTTPAMLHRAIADVLDAKDRFRPRAWAMDHIPSSRAQDRLNEILREHARASGRPWTRDLARMCWRPDPIYQEPREAASMQIAYDELFDRYGLVFRDHRPSTAPRTPREQDGRAVRELMR
jgi:hypothetical protein